MMNEQYEPQSIESAVQAHWELHQTFQAIEDPSREKFYCLSMFPYPSGRLHMGHVRNYTIGDVIARIQRMCGKNVLQPIGWDAFGLPAENAAIKNQVPPAVWTYQNIEEMRRQLKSLGFSYDWSREITTCRPEYYRWEQWLFKRLFEKDLVYKKNTLVNWDPVDQTVLANEQVVDGRGWRSGALVEQREISQWFFRITAYAEELLAGLTELPGWPESVRTMQTNWIGRSEGVDITFKVQDTAETLSVFTTRPDTLYGVTYLAIAPQHPLALKSAMHNIEMEKFLQACRALKVDEATLTTQEKKGLPSGFFAVNPLNGEVVPIWVTNYVLMNYGTGAVMAVPAHDERDFEFAMQYHLPIKTVIQNATVATIPLPSVPFAPSAPSIPSIPSASPSPETPYFSKGILINSGPYTNMNFDEAFDAITTYLGSLGAGKRRINYRLRDWGISRQRYWGTPIPIVYCDKCGVVTVSDEDLPVVLPEQVQLDVEGIFLKKYDAFRKTSCPTCQGPAERETDTFDTFMESSWYYARFACPKQNNMMLDERVNYWLPVDHYIGGIEHAVMHLLYARFIHKVLRDESLLNCDEPFVRLLTQGMVIKDGAKMSKSKGNVVDPQILIQQYGADTVRVFSMFAAPPEQNLEWSDAGVAGAHRYLKRVWACVFKHVQSGAAPTLMPDTYTIAQQAVRQKIHQTVQKVTVDMRERLTFNTAIASLMELTQILMHIPLDTDNDRAVSQEGLSVLVRLLSPIAPHICHILWQALGYQDPIETAVWPVVDVAALASDTMDLVIQVNGKLRANITVAVSATQNEIETAAISHPNIERFVAAGSVQKIIVVPNRLVNIVIKNKE